MADLPLGYYVIPLLQVCLHLRVISRFDSERCRLNYRRGYERYIEGPAWCVLASGEGE